MNTIKNALEKCRTYVAVQKFGCGHTGIGHGVEDNLLQLLNEVDEELARLEKREPTLMSDCISAGLPLAVALKYDVQLCRLTNYVRDKTLADCVKQEPVAWALMHKNGLEFNTGYGMVKTLQEAEDMQRRHLGDVKIVPLYTPPPAIEAAIEATKEKAAKVCDGYAANSSHPMNFAENCAAAIRSMK